MKIHYKLILSVAIVALFASCSKEDTNLEPSEINFTDTSVQSDRAGEALLKRFKEIQDKYKTIVVYDFTEKEIKQTLVQGASGGSVGNYEDFLLTETTNLAAQFDWVEKTLFAPSSDKFLAEFLPFKIYLAGKFTNSQFNDPSHWAYSIRNAIQVAYTSSSFIFGYGNGDFPNSRFSNEYQRYNLEQNNFWNFIVTSGKLHLLFPEAFFEVSDYSLSLRSDWMDYAVPSETNYRNVYKPTAAMLANGMLDSNSPRSSSKQENDARSFYTFMRYFPKDSPVWQDLLSNPKVKQKYDLFRNHLMETYNYDPHNMAITF